MKQIVTFSGPGPLLFLMKNAEKMVSCENCQLIAGPCLGGNSCCQSFRQCSEGEGDCDDDVDCVGGLKQFFFLQGQTWCWRYLKKEIKKRYSFLDLGEMAMTAVLQGALLEDLMFPKLPF